MLINHHANPLIVNQQQRTAIDMAKYHERRYPDHNISELLIQYSKVVQQKYQTLVNKMLLANQQETQLAHTIMEYIFETPY